MRRQRILVVGGDYAEQSELFSHLQRNGYMVDSVQYGYDALNFFAEQGPPQLVLLEMDLPDMRGMALAAQIQRQYRIPMIALSAVSDTETIALAITHYVEDYVTKPYSYRELIARINRVLAH
jgi:DNA-binding response OmpR family regulator